MHNNFPHALLIPYPNQSTFPPSQLSPKRVPTSPIPTSAPPIPPLQRVTILIIPRLQPIQPTLHPTKPRSQVAAVDGVWVCVSGCPPHRAVGGTCCTVRAAEVNEFAAPVTDAYHFVLGFCFRLENGVYKGV